MLRELRKLLLQGAVWVALSALATSCVAGVLILVAILVAGAAYRFINEIRHEAKARAGKAKSTKRPVAVKGVVIDRLSGGKMADSRILMDTLSMMQQLGVA